jgi:hypothetical protein
MLALMKHLHLSHHPDRLLAVALRHLTHHPAQVSCVGSDSKNNSERNPSVSSYYKINNQTAIDIAAGKVIL